MVSLDRQLVRVIVSVGLKSLLVDTRQSQAKGDYTSIIILIELLIKFI